MEEFKNLYQLSKTLRFGLTLKDKKRKDGYTKEIYGSHNQLKDLVRFTEKRIEEEITTVGINYTAELLAEKIRKCLNNMQSFISQWNKIYYRKDQVAVDKDFYKKLSKKNWIQRFLVCKEKNKR